MNTARTSNPAMRWFAIAAIAALIGGCAGKQHAPKSETPAPTVAVAPPAAAVQATPAPALPPPIEDRAARIADAKKRRGDHYAKRLELFMNESPKAQPGGTVFIGDSITEGFQVASFLPGRNVINRGIGGDKIDGVRERIDVSARDLAPSRAFVLIGVNEFAWGNGGKAAEMAPRYEAMVKELRAAAPKADISLIGILPLTGRFAPANATALEMNEAIKAIAARQNVRYVDLHTPLKDAKGELRADYTTDGIHLNLAAYRVWCEVLFDGEERFEAMRGIAPKWKKLRATGRGIAAIDPKRTADFSGRGENQLIVYTPAGGFATTGTNPWGVEAIVDNGVVTAVSPAGNAAIPAGGYVVSGHGEAAQWISANLRVGIRVEQDKQTVRVLLPEPKDAHERAELLGSEYLVNLATLLEKKPSKDRLDEARVLYERLLGLRSAESPDPKDIDGAAAAVRGIAE